MSISLTLSHRRLRAASSCFYRLRFDQRLIHLADLIGLFGRDDHRIGELQGFEIILGGGIEPSQFLVDLPHQQTGGETEILMLDGMLQDAGRQIRGGRPSSGASPDQNKARDG